MEQKVLRVSTLVIVGALVLRLLSAGNLGQALQFTLSPEAASWMIFFQTGRLVRPGNISFTDVPQPTVPDMPTGITPVPTQPTVPNTSTETTPVPTQPGKPFIPTFSADAAAAIQIKSSFSYTADLPTLLTQPLQWELTRYAPTVLILHAHATESFTGGGYSESSPYHTLDTGHNMVSIGKYVAEALEDAGISVIHDTTLHDSPSYDLSYTNSRESVEKYLKKYPSIRLVLDLHRDSYEDAAGNQAAHTVFSHGQAIAPLMFVVGTNYGGLTHPNWQENLSLALKLQTQLESLCPGICRNLNLRSQRFNQDLSAGSLLVEVGASGNTYAEALGAARMLVNAILSLAHGANYI